MSKIIDWLKKITRPWTNETEIPRLCFKITQLVLNLVCFGIAVYEYTEFFEKNIPSIPKADVNGQTWSRVSFIGITVAMSTITLGMIITHCVARRNQSYALKPSSEVSYYMIVAASLLTVSISLLVRYLRLGDLGIKSELMFSDVVCGFVDAVVYIIPAVQIWRGL